MNNKFFLIFFTFLLLLFCSAQNTFAVTTNIIQSPTAISNTPFSIFISITGAKAGKNYLRADIYKQGSTEYVGETFNGQDWYNGDDGTKYAPVDITGSETQTTTISARLSSISTSWNASDSFFLRIRRYTASGSYTSSEAEANATAISIIFPTTAPLPTGGPSPIPTPTTQSPTASPTSTPTPTLPATSQNSLAGADNIFISEVLTAPELGQHEWIELFNNNDFPVTLNSWFIDDIENAGSSPQAFTLTINPKSYATIDIQSALFNNDGDSVRLLDDQKIQKDIVSYSQTQQGKSISRNNLNSHEICTTLLTKNQPNSSCITSSTTTTSTLSAAQRELINQNNEDIILGDSTQNPNSTFNPLTAPDSINITAFQGIGHDSTYPQPSDYQDEPLRSPQFPPNIFHHPSWTGLIKTGATSAAGISLLNIMYILYRIKPWRPHFPSKIFSSIGSRWSPG